MGHFNNRAKLTSGLLRVGGDWVTVMTPFTYDEDSMVVVATPVDAGDPGAVIRVRNASGSSFEVRAEPTSPAGEAPIDEPIVDEIDVSWIVMAAGVYSIDRPGQPKIRFEGWRFGSVNSDFNFSLSGRRASYLQPYLAPVVVGQVMSDNAPWSTFWARGPLFSAAPTWQALYVGHHTGTDSQRRGPETLGVMVFETGDFELNGTKVVAGTLPLAIVDGESASVDLPFDATAAVASPGGFAARTGYWPELVESTLDEAPNHTLTVRLATNGTPRVDTPETIAYVAVNPTNDAARFLVQAAFGGDQQALRDVSRTGYAQWLDDQVTAPVSLTEPYMNELNAIEQPFGPVTAGGRTMPEQIAIRDSYPHNFSFANEGNPDATNHATAWMRNLVHGEDQLRQRVTLALSQIMVISQNASRLKFAGASMASYYDMLATNALGNFRDLLEGVTFHPAMAYYLSHVGNRKADPSKNQFPDENFAREVMQLFTIGLWELNADGTRQVDADGQPVPTYDNDDITNLARVLTGLWYEGYEFGEPKWMLDVQGYERPPLAMFTEWHDFEPKVVFADKPWRLELPGTVDGMAEIQIAIDALFNHPNTAPFVCRRLIQFLTVSNPTPGYIERVGAVFADNGKGVRGDLHAVVKTILLDPEARGYFPERPDYGKLLEPIIRLARMVKVFRAGTDSDDLVFWRHTRDNNELGQWPLNSPSVFNFFEPDYQHQGPLSDAGVFSPELQIHNSVTAITMPNELAEMIDRFIQRYKPAITPRFAFDLATEIDIADDPSALVERLNMLLCSGQMSAEMQSVIEVAVTRIPLEGRPAMIERARLAVWLCAISPDSAVLI